MKLHCSLLLTQNNLGIAPVKSYSPLLTQNNLGIALPGEELHCSLLLTQNNLGIALPGEELHCSLLLTQNNLGIALPCEELQSTAHLLQPGADGPQGCNVGLQHFILHEHLLFRVHQQHTSRLQATLPHKTNRA